MIAVQSNLKIQDKAAQIFSKSFYMELMQGNSIKQAFKSAKDSLIAKHHSSCYTCCCAHKHTDSCLWYLDSFGFFFEGTRRTCLEVKCLIVLIFGFGFCLLLEGRLMRLIMGIM